MKKLAWIVFIGSCILISFQPVKYLLADGPIGLLNSKPIESNMYMFSFYIHITLGGIALFIGWTQFSKKLRRKYLKLHRIIGKIYVTAILIGGPFAFYLGFFVYGGLPTQIGFTFGAIIWILFTFMGYSSIRKGDVAKHKEYMMYSYAGTCAAIVLRLVLPPLMMITSFKVAYGISVWLSWMPSVLLVYLFVHKKKALVSFYRTFYIKQVAITIIVISASTFLLSFTSIQTWFYKSPSHKGIPFEKAVSTDSSSFTKEKLIEIENYIKKESETTSMIVIEHGKIVYEYGDVSEISHLSTARESILSILYGKYVEDGTINLDETIGNIGIEENIELMSIEKKATVDDLMSSRSGVFYPLNNSYTNNDSKRRGSVKPGEYFLYSNWDYNVGGYILEKKTTNTVFLELEQQLAIPLGFEDWNIVNQAKKSNANSRYPAHEMHLSTRDMAKIGQLMLQEGQWNGEQIISKEWIKKITSVVTPMDTVSLRKQEDISHPTRRAYGYGWWIFNRLYDNPDFKGAYTAAGANGQFITVIPKRDVVIAHKTNTDILTYAGFSDRTSTPDFRYSWILRHLLLNRKRISELSSEKSIDEIVQFIKTEYDKDSKYAISERLINEYGLELASKGKHLDAIKLFELNLKLYPHGYFTHRILNYYGNSLMKLGRDKEALKAFEESLEFNSDNPRASEMISKLNPSLLKK